jgi:hypothetical protein
MSPEESKPACPARPEVSIKIEWGGSWYEFPSREAARKAGFQLPPE